MLSTYWAQTIAANRMAFADRTNFFLQAGGMLVNNLFFLLLWFLFFAGFRSVGGWQLQDVALLLGLIMTIVGASGVAFGGYRDMAATILRGETDVLLTQPKPILPRLLARETIASGWGDFVNGLILLAFAAGLSWSDLPFVAFALIAGLTVYVSAGVSFASMAFWFAGARSFARDLTDFLILMSSYPGSIFKGATQVIAYTVLPAGFVVLTPVAMLRDPRVETVAAVAAGALGYAVVAWALFEIGLRQYRRGSAPIAG